MNALVRRGACPRLAAPMATGDGLLVRMVPTGQTIGLDALAALCDAAHTHGNGVLEITSRGNIQVRGLNAASAPTFASMVEALGIHCGDRIPVLTNPLGGLDPQEAFDVAPLADALRQHLAASDFLSRLSEKVSVIVDGGGLLPLDDVVADIRLRAAEGQTGFQISLAGDATTAVPLGTIGSASVVDCVVRLLDRLAGFAPRTRIRDVLRAQGVSVFQSAVADLIVRDTVSVRRVSAQPIGLHRLQGDRYALGIGLPFGHSSAETLSALANAARNAGASGVRASPGRTLLVVGLNSGSALALAVHAGSIGFVIDPADPRRRIVACAGSPVCASGQIPSRSLAPEIAKAAGTAALADGEVVHVSGCAKGCAHPSPAAIAVYGRDGVCDIRVHDKLSCTVPVGDLVAQIARIVSARPESGRG